MTVGTVVWRRSSSWGTMQTDSRISEKTQSSCETSQQRTSVGCVEEERKEDTGARKDKDRGTATHLHERAAANDMGREDQVPKGRDDEGSEQAVHAHLPGLLALTGAGVDAGHEEDDVQGRQSVKDLEGEVPRVLGILGGARGEDVQVAGAEDEGVQGLGDERDALGAAVGVDGPYEDQLGRRVRHVAEDVEEVELHRAPCRGGARAAVFAGITAAVAAVAAAAAAAAAACAPAV